MERKGKTRAPQQLRRPSVVRRGKCPRQRRREDQLAAVSCHSTASSSCSKTLHFAELTQTLTFCRRPGVCQVCTCYDLHISHGHVAPKTSREARKFVRGFTSLRGLLLSFISPQFSLAKVQDIDSYIRVLLTSRDEDRPRKQNPVRLENKSTA